VTIPTKEEFQELIDFCKKDYLPNGLIIRPNSAVEDLRKILYAFALTREKALKEMKSLAAFYWLDEGNRDNQYNFKKALTVVEFEIISNIDDWVQENTLIILSTMKNSPERITEDQKYLEDGATESITVPDNTLLEIIYTQTGLAREYEMRVMHFVCCLMDYNYPKNRDRDKNTIKLQLTKVISTLEELQILESDLHNREEFSYLPEIIDICKPLEGRVEVYQKILEGGYLPFKRRSDHSHDKRIFILNVYKVISCAVHSECLPIGMDILKISESYLLETLGFLMSISCFDKPMTENSIRNILKAERLRLVNRFDVVD